MSASTSDNNSGIVVKSAAWYTISNLLVKASGFITVPIFTRVLTQAEYGIYSNFLSWVAVFGIFTSLSLESTLISAIKDYRNRLAIYSFSISILSMILACGWWLVCLPMLPFLSSVLSLDSVYIDAMFVFLLFQPIVNVFQAYERYRFRYKATVASSVAVSLGSACGSVILAITMPNSLMGVIVGRVLPMTLVGSILWLLLYRDGKRVDFSCWRYAIPISLPFVPHLLSMTLLGSLNKIFIIKYVGAEANAIYSIAYNFGLIITTFTTSLNSAFAPWMAEKLINRSLSTIRRVSIPYVGTFCLFSICACLLAPEVVAVLGGEGYEDAALLIPWISIGCVCQFLYGLYVNIEQFEKKTMGMAVASMSAAAINAALDLILVPRFGYQAAALCTALSYGWLLFVHMMLVRRLGLLAAYSTKLNLLFVAGSCAASLLISLFYDNLLLRLLLLAIFGSCFILLLARIRGIRSSKS